MLGAIKGEKKREINKEKTAGGFLSLEEKKTLRSKQNLCNH